MSILKKSKDSYVSRKHLCSASNNTWILNGDPKLRRPRWKTGRFVSRQEWQKELHEVVPILLVCNEKGNLHHLKSQEKRDKLEFIPEEKLSLNSEHAIGKVSRTQYNMDVNRKRRTQGNKNQRDVIKSTSCIMSYDMICKLTARVEDLYNSEEALET